MLSTFLLDIGPPLNILEGRWGRKLTTTDDYWLTSDHQHLLKVREGGEKGCLLKTVCQKRDWGWGLGWVGWLNWQMLNSRCSLLSAFPHPPRSLEASHPNKASHSSTTNVKTLATSMCLQMFRSMWMEAKKSMDRKTICLSNMDSGSWKHKCTMCSCVDAGLLVRKRKIFVRPPSRDFKNCLL